MNYLFFSCFLSLILPFNQAQGQQSVLDAAIKKKYCKLTADYIVVGVGTAGGLMTARLSDDLKTSVIALHNGPNLTNDFFIKFSALARVTVISALFPFGLYIRGATIPQAFADLRQLLWVVALPLGGASSINAGAYCRGTEQFYADMATLAGPRWAPSEILNVYKKLENYDGQAVDPEQHGFNGPLDIRVVQQPSQISLDFTNAIITAVNQIVPSFPDVNIPDYNNWNTPIGASAQVQYTQTGPEGELRESSATAFLNSSVMTPDGFGVNGRKLRVLFDSSALKILWSGNRAIGVEFNQNGVTQHAFARKGVVVCAGLLSSPFLMHSGVGPRNLLQSLNIPVVVDNPLVGQGLVDQPSIRMTFFSPLGAGIQNPSNIFEQIAWLPDPNGTNPQLRALRFASVNAVPGLTIGILDLCRTKSTGSITIDSADPLAKPIVNLGVLSNNDDLRLFRQGLIDYVPRILAALPAGYQLVDPDPNILNNPIAVDAYIRKNVSSNQHFQGHCGLGRVVDSSGLVIGTQNIYVADDSIIPICMDGSPMATAYLAAAHVVSQILKK